MSIAATQPGTGAITSRCIVDPLSMDHPWPMVHSLSMVYGRSCGMFSPWSRTRMPRCGGWAGGLSLHVFRNIFGRFFLFLAEQGGCWVGVAGRGCHDVEAEREAFFPCLFGWFCFKLESNKHLFSNFWLSSECCYSVRDSGLEIILGVRKII